MRRPRSAFAGTLCLMLLNVGQTLVSAVIIISEIAGKGSSNVCGNDNHDWIELYNNDTSEIVSLAGYILHDDKGMNDTKAFTFPPNYAPLLPGEYRLICTMMPGGNDTSSPQFSIGGDDVITLVSRDGSTVVASVGPLPDTHNAFDITYAWDSDPDRLAVTSIERPAEHQSTVWISGIGGYNYYYTSTPTPGLPNILTQVGETADEIKQRLTLQNDLGSRFFGMDAHGFPVADALDAVLDLHLAMKDDDYHYMMENTGFEVYLPFASARLVSAADSLAQEEVVLSISSPGEIRTKGQSSLYFATCAGTTTVPFQLEFDALASLFGVERMYLRNHILDATFMRDWSMNRMLARFGLPHLRTRKLRFYINGDYIGFYDAVEAVDQEYVFARNFAEYNPFNYSLYKRKIESIGCGLYDPDTLADAATRLDDPSKPPYNFESGTHRDPIPVHGRAGLPLCMNAFAEKFLIGDVRDVATLYLKYNEDCGEMLVQEGLVERDLGTKNWDSVMSAFINEYLVAPVVSGNSDMDQQVDLESFLKTTAVLAFVLSQDSVLGSTNNYYMAQAGDGKGLKLLVHDHNIGPAKGTSCPCDNPLSWSIARPTCGAMELNLVVGPLLLKPDLHARYLGYVQAFIDQVAGAPDMLEEITNHAHAIYRYVKEDYFQKGNFRVQFSTDPADWEKGLVPFLLARANDVRQQLAAIDEGTIPRGPHQLVKEANYETCVDWRIAEAPAVGCYNDCLYEGCHMVNWQLSHQCIEETGTCIHGTYDPECRGIPEGEQYAGMESPRASTGLETFCTNSREPFTIKASVCPPPPPPDQDMYNFDAY